MSIKHKVVAVLAVAVLGLPFISFAQSVTPGTAAIQEQIAALIRIGFIPACQTRQCRSVFGRSPFVEAVLIAHI